MPVSRCQLKSAVRSTSGTSPSTAARSTSAPMARSSQARRECPEGQLSPHLGAQPLAPPGLVPAQAPRVQAIAAERRIEHLRGPVPAEQTVIAPSTGRGLAETGGIAHCEEPSPIGPANWGERQDLQAWFRPARSVRTALTTHPLDKFPKPARGPSLAHEARSWRSSTPRA